MHSKSSNYTYFATALAALFISPFSLFADEAQKGGSPFNGKDLNNWETKAPKGKRTNKWTTGIPKMPEAGSGTLISEPAKEGETAAMVNVVTGHGQGLDIFSKDKFGDMKLEIELMVPKGSNSGIYVMGEYEVQVLDSHGKPDDKMNAGDIGAIYGAAVPKINASKAPGEWQKFVIEFQAPKFDNDGKKTANAKFVKVELNGKVLHENLEMKGPTPAGVTGKEHALGPIMFQGDHGAVAFRNIKVSPLK